VKPTPKLHKWTIVTPGCHPKLAIGYDEVANELKPDSDPTASGGQGTQPREHLDDEGRHYFFHAR